jgi:antitoxin component YwqK of YwqJK toxin-antitoxin module
MKNTVFIIILTIVLACNNGPKERVMSTYGDGKPMMIVYEDPKTGEKLQEKTFYNNEQVHTDILYKDKKRDGTCRSFYKDGKPFSLHTYTLGILNGPYQLWYENGQVRIDGFYKDNQKMGVWKSYNQDGSVFKIENFDSKDSTIIAQP